MKTETQIAEENIERKDRDRSKDASARCPEHKATCQRFLEFLEREYRYLKDLNILALSAMERKITDLKQAIKLYNEAGI